MNSTINLKKDLLSCPGDTIQEQLDFINMSQSELALRMGRSESKLNELIKGKAPLTPETAKKLEYVLGIDASFWMNLENAYQQELLAIKQLEFLKQCSDWIKGFPLKELKVMKLLPNTTKATELMDKLLSFFRVASPEEWSKIYEYEALAFKIDAQYIKDPKTISTWLRIGEIQADRIEIQEFDKKKLTRSIPAIQALMYENPEDWLNRLQSICASFGVALVYTPCLSKAPIYGASRWIKNKTIPLIQLTDRQKDYNAFWFSFFHELAHIRYHNKSDIFISLTDIQQDDSKELEADRFASEMLLNETERREVFSYNSYNKSIILALSTKLKKHPGIIVSQIQRKHKALYKDFALNSLKTRVEFKELVFE